MKKVLRKSFCFFMMMSCLCTTAFAVSSGCELESGQQNSMVTDSVTRDISAQEMEKLLEFDSVTAKKELKSYALAQSRSVTSADCFKAMELLENSALSGESTEERTEKMRQYGIYRLETPIATVAEPYSSSNYVSLYAPEIYYQSSDDTWIVLMSGRWRSRGWSSDAPYFVSGNYANIGGEDSIGFCFYNTSGSFNSRMVACHYTVTDRDGTSKQTGDTRSSYNSAAGLSMNFQDKYYPNGEYMSGERFSCSAVYDSNFEDYHGLAASFYCHTWNNTDISSVVIGLSGSGPNVEIEYTVNNPDEYICYSGADTSF